MEVKFGDVYYVDCGKMKSHVQSGLRPAVIWQNNVGNRYSPNVVVIPITSAIKRLDMPTHVLIPAKESGLPVNSMALCEHPITIAMDELCDYVSHLPDKILIDMAKGSIMASSAIALLDDKNIKETKEKAGKLI